jgi:hypothetical protein
MLPSSPFAITDLARQQQAEIARQARRGQVRPDRPGRRRGRRRRWR